MIRSAKRFERKTLYVQDALSGLRKRPYPYARIAGKNGVDDGRNRSHPVFWGCAARHEGKYA